MHRAMLVDFDRPLNPRGRRDAPRMGQRLARRHEYPDLMLSSPANRALTTARIIAEQIRYPDDGIRLDERVYHASTEELLDVVRQLDAGFDKVMMFGHNPGFTDFANVLADEDIENIPTCGIFCVGFPIDDWRETSRGGAELVYFDYPKKRE